MKTNPMTNDRVTYAAPLTMRDLNQCSSDTTDCIPATQQSEPYHSVFEKMNRSYRDCSLLTGAMMKRRRQVMTTAVSILLVATAIMACGGMVRHGLFCVDCSRCQTDTF